MRSKLNTCIVSSSIGVTLSSIIIFAVCAFSSVTAKTKLVMVLIELINITLFYSIFSIMDDITSKLHKGVGSTNEANEKL